jgi:hypothetical protein
MEVLEEKPVIVPHFLQETSHGLTRDRTRTTEVMKTEVHVNYVQNVIL